MNLRKLFEIQKVLREKIGYEGEDRFKKLLLALLVEVGECANEWRGFKFWSKNQNPSKLKYHYTNTGGLATSSDELPTEKEENDLFSRDINEPMRIENPLLEEYVDGLHFVLELGLEFEWTPVICDLYMQAPDVNEQFIALYQSICKFEGSATQKNYYDLLMVFVGLSYSLGFTSGEVEKAYLDKNKVNHERQANGY